MDIYINLKGTDCILDDRLELYSELDSYDSTRIIHMG